MRRFGPGHRVRPSLRLGYHLGPVGDDLAQVDAAVIRSGVKKIADYLPVVRSAAERRERLAHASKSPGVTIRPLAVLWQGLSRAIVSLPNPSI